MMKESRLLVPTHSRYPIVLSGHLIYCKSPSGFFFFFWGWVGYRGAVMYSEPVKVWLTWCNSQNTSHYVGQQARTLKYRIERQLQYKKALYGKELHLDVWPLSVTSVNNWFAYKQLLQMTRSTQDGKKTQTSNNWYTPFIYFHFTIDLHNQMEVLTP